MRVHVTCARAGARRRARARARAGVEGVFPNHQNQQLVDEYLVGIRVLPFTFKHMFELLLVSFATVLAKGKTLISTNYPSTNYRFWSFQVVRRRSLSRAREFCQALGSAPSDE